MIRQVYLEQYNKYTISKCLYYEVKLCKFGLTELFCSRYSKLPTARGLEEM
jgi:hypothetical protein